MERPRESNGPPHVLSYSGPSPLSVARELTYERSGDTLTIVIPPAPLTWQITSSAILLIVCGVPEVILVGFIVSGVFSVRRPGPENYLCPAIAAAFFGWGAIYGLRRLIYIARQGRFASRVTVSPAGLEILGPGTTQALNLSVSRARIADVTVHPGGFGRNPKIRLEIICTDDTMHLIALPWPRGMPMVELEDNVRDVLGLRSAEEKSRGIPPST